MNEPIEARLRKHLAVVDRLPVNDSDAVVAAAQRAGEQRRRRRRTAAAIASSGLLRVGSVALWSNRSDAPTVVSSDTDTDGTPPSDQTEPATTVPAAAAASEPPQTPPRRSCPPADSGRGSGRRDPGPVECLGGDRR